MKTTLGILVTIIVTILFATLVIIYFNNQTQRSNASPIKNQEELNEKFLNSLYETPLKPTETQTSEPNPLQKEMKEAYMEGCLEGNEPTTHAFCSCTYDDLIKRVGTSGFVTMSLEVERTGLFNEKTMDTMVESMTACAHHIF